MALEIKRKEKESPQKLILRFIKKMKESGILLEAKKKQFYQPEPNPREKKLSALRREKMKEYYEKLSKGRKVLKFS